MPAEWRSGAAQTFVGGRITRIEGFWHTARISHSLFRFFDDWDLWDTAFPGSGSTMKKEWKSFNAGDGFLKGLANKAAKTVGAASTGARGTALVAALEAQVTQPLQRLLQDTPLTINFKAASWFRDQAGFDHYVSMWERKRTDAGLNTSPDPKNPAEVRAKADRWALYGQFDDGKQETRAAGLQLAHVKKQGGQLAAPTWSHSTGSPGKTPKTVVADSQVFAALNYGRRMHGANTEYGMSFFELSDDYKPAAIYFAMDTFTPVSTGSGYRSKAQRSKLYQVSAGPFGGAILLAIKSQYDGSPSATNKQNSIALIEELFRSARNSAPRPDTNQNHLLIEAHVFQKVPMQAQTVSRVNISRSECGADLSTVRANAELFRQRTSVMVRFID